MQQLGEFTMLKRTLTAPWSPRLQPAILEMQNPITVPSPVAGGPNITLRAPWLLLYEGNYYDPFSTTARLENDVWASTDGGERWQLIAGISIWGDSGSTRAAAPYWQTSFVPRGGSNNCEDPYSDDVYSVAGYTLGRGYRVASNDVWMSSSGLQWSKSPSSFWPGRWYSSCDVNSQSHLLLMGGELGGSGGGGGGQMLNDVWAAERNLFKRITDRAPWRARAQHVVLVGTNQQLSREIVYVLGGALYFDSNSNDASKDVQANDVWASSDEGRTWAFVATAPWATRYGHSGVITQAGVLVIMGGFHSEPGQAARQQLNDVWTSFDGGVTWRQTVVDLNTRLIAVRGLQGSTLTREGVLYLASGVTTNNVPTLSDVWFSTFSLSDSTTLADMSNTQVPSAGIGLQAWPQTVQPPATFYVDQTTAVAPWSPRIQPAVLWMYKPVQYQQVGTNAVISTGSPWLLLYDGGLTDADGVNENDVWASTDEGMTWDLISGISRQGLSGVVESKLPQASFVGRGGSSNCEDPTSDTVYSIGGFGSDFVATNEVWSSEDGLTWYKAATPTFTPGRWFSSCDVSVKSHVLSMGGVDTEGALLNDVWLMQNSIWTRSTEHAPWPARCEHLVLIGDNPLLKTEVLYMLGGATTWDNLGETAGVSNDVWVSVDEGTSWLLVTAQAAWPSRWGHSGVITAAGVLLVFGGTSGGKEVEYQSYRDMWASFDGGIVWSQCAVEGGDTNGWIRGEQGSTMTDDEYLLLAGGYLYEPGRRDDSLRDAWRSTFSLSDSARLAAICNTTIPAAGIGLVKWPNPNTGGGGGDARFGATQINTQTPFSARIQPALLTMYNPITYTQVGSLQQVTTGSPWLLLYEGTFAWSIYEQWVQENDVWASRDEGRSWDLISGVSYFGTSGVKAAVLYASSFTPRVGSTNCEDPTSDRVYSLGGQVAERDGLIATNQVWHSDDALVWQQVQMDTFEPARWFSSCDVNSNQLLLLMGGQPSDTEALNDVWHATDNGNTWTLVTRNAPWPRRSEHLVLVGAAPLLGVELVYVIGGFQYDSSNSNDVWVSSDEGRTWQFVTNAAFGPRWGHGGIITSSGAMMVFGGTSTISGITFHDAWLSFNGGISWTSCSLSSGSDSPFIRGEQAVGLTAREELLIATGYSYDAAGGRTTYRDMWQTQFSLDDITQLEQMCHQQAPSAGIGLPVWNVTGYVPPVQTSTGNSGGSTGTNGTDPEGATGVDNGGGGGGGGGGTNLTALLIVFIVLVGVGGAGAGGYYWHKRRGSGGGRFAQFGGGGGGGGGSGGGALDLSEWSGRNREFSDSSAADWANQSRGNNGNTNGSSGGGGLSALKRFAGSGWGGGSNNHSSTGFGSSSSSGGNSNSSASENYYTGSSNSSSHGRSGGGADGGFSRGGNSLLAEDTYVPPNRASPPASYDEPQQYNMELSGRQRFGGDPLGASGGRQGGQVGGGWGGSAGGGDPLGGRPVQGGPPGGAANDDADPFGIGAAGRARQWH